MKLERKILVSVGAICLVVCVCAFIIMAFRIHPIAGISAVAISAWWIGGAITEVLQKEKVENASSALSEAKSLIEEVCNSDRNDPPPFELIERAEAFLKPHAPSIEAAFAWKKLRDEADRLNKAVRDAEIEARKANDLNLKALEIEKEFTAIRLSVFEVWHKAEAARIEASKHKCPKCGGVVYGKDECEKCAEVRREEEYRATYPGDED